MQQVTFGKQLALNASDVLFMTLCMVIGSIGLLTLTQTISNTALIALILGTIAAHVAYWKLWRWRIARRETLFAWLNLGAIFFLIVLSVALASLIPPPQP